MRLLLVAVAVWVLGLIAPPLLDHLVSRETHHRLPYSAQAAAWLAAFIAILTDPVQGWLMKLPTIPAFLLVTMCGAVLLGGSHVVARRFLIQPKTAAPKATVVGPPQPTELPAKPGIYTRYDRVGRIPNSPPGQAELYVLHLNREHGKGGLRIDDESPDDPTSPAIYRCLVQNIGNIPLQEVRLGYTASFFRGDKPEGGNESSEHYTVSIPPLRAGDEYVLYIRNDSPVGVMVDVPSDAPVRSTPAGDTLTVELKWDIQNLPGSTPPGWGVLTFDGAKPANGPPTR
jgi:hypothetical protein